MLRVPPKNYQSNIFGTFVDQVKRLVALIYERFEAIRHNTHSRIPFKNPLVKCRPLLYRSLSQ
jgi:hypothetical protein